MPQLRSSSPARLTAIWIAVLGLSLGPGCGEQDSTTAPRRFEVHAVQTSSGPILVRFDTATGELTQSALTGGRDWLPLGSATGGEAAGGRRAGRYSLDYIQAPSIPLTFVRVDSETGAVWRIGHPGDREWTALRSSGAPEPSAPAPAAARERRPRAPAARPLVPDAGEVETLVDAATSPDLPLDMRTWAVEQLAASPSRLAVGHLVDLLADPDPSVVRVAVRALAKHDDPRVRPALEQLKQHEAAEVRRVAESALSEPR